jgi:hypothetical protein
VLVLLYKKDMSLREPRGGRLEVIPTAEAKGDEDWVVLDMNPAAVAELYKELKVWMEVLQKEGKENLPFCCLHFYVTAKHPMALSGKPSEDKRDGHVMRPQPSLFRTDL